jgi:hypothetical protein
VEVDEIEKPVGALIVTSPTKFVPERLKLALEE